MIDTCEFTRKDLVPPDLIVRKYFDAEFTPEGKTPAFDTILQHQFEDAEVVDFFYVFLGRLFFPVKERDNWQVMMFLFGEAQTGKSTAIRIIMAMFDRVGSIDQSFDQKFGLGGLYEQELIVIDDLPRNIKDCFPQQTWQMMVSGGPVTIRLMQKSPFSVDWKVPQIWAGNWLPNFDDKGQVSRRFITWRFENTLESGIGKANLDSEIIENELPAIMYKAWIAYQKAVIAHGNDLLYDWCPAYFRETRDELRSERNPLFRFLTESPLVSYEEGSRTSAEHIRPRFAQFLGMKSVKNLDRGTFAQVDKRWTVKAANACRVCGSVTGSGCCDQFRHSQRKKTFEIVNLKLE